MSGLPSVLPGSGFDAEITVCNQGTTPGSSMVELRLSADATITQADALAGSAPMPYLDPGRCAAVTIPAGVYVAADGAYHLGGIVDPHGWQPELIETNNAAAGSVIGVGYWPDLVVSAVSGPPSVTPGSELQRRRHRLQRRVDGRARVDVELLLRATSHALGHPRRERLCPRPEPRQCARRRARERLCARRAHHLGAIVDLSGVLAELIETNNAAAGSVIGVGYAPISSSPPVSGPPSTIPGGSFDASVTVCNQGTDELRRPGAACPLRGREPHVG